MISTPDRGKILSRLPICALCSACLFAPKIRAEQGAGYLRLDAGDRVEDSLLKLSGPWKYHPGDRPDGADPALDNADWEMVSSRLAPGHLPHGGWPVRTG
jgi:hypothetical protein